MNKELEFLEEKYGHNSWKHYPPSKQQVAQWLQEFTEKQFAIQRVSQQRELLLAWEEQKYFDFDWAKNKEVITAKIDEYLANNCG